VLVVSVIMYNIIMNLALTRCGISSYALQTTITITIVIGLRVRARVEDVVIMKNELLTALLLRIR
jgi:hypothetical protein